MSKEAKVLTGILLLVVVGMIGLFVMANGGGNATDTSTADPAVLVRSDSNKTGTGKVQVVEFGDFQCPACGATEPVIQQLLAAYRDKITLVFRNFPLSQHQNAQNGAEAAEAAGAQGKYWDMHDKLYATQADWSDLADPSDLFAQYATAMGLDGAKVKDAVKNQTYKAKIDKDTADGTTLQVNSTPTIYIAGKLMTAHDYNSLRDAVEAALKK
jgi:protein-disulfide isomerase